ncbi:MAG: transglycosylase SLT domain-containing protein [Marinosulfonomonas sp.]|nr:transglycosylase SLT domain-containing protein [Marinosulfonomonas sp.]
MTILRVLTVLAVLAGATACGSAKPSKPAANISELPVMRWDHRPEAAIWTRATLAAIQRHGQALLTSVPRDITSFCPAYPGASDADRAAFWSGLLSALAKHESTWRPEAAGGGGKWIGLTQIDPRTAAGYGCDAQSVSQLKDGAANLSCAVRIAAHQVGRDEYLVTNGDSWRGIARDWAPFRNDAKLADMAAWTSTQSYCRR